MQFKKASLLRLNSCYLPNALENSRQRHGKRHKKLPFLWIIIMQCQIDDHHVNYNSNFIKINVNFSASFYYSRSAVVLALFAASHCKINIRRIKIICPLKRHTTRRISVFGDILTLLGIIPTFAPFTFNFSE